MSARASAELSGDVRRAQRAGSERRIARMAETQTQSLAEQLEGIGTQLAWVRDYL